jgi:hypothetical protein
MPEPSPSEAETSAALRVAALTKFPGQLSNKFGISESVAIGICMEFWVKNAVVSLICFIDGNVSLYFSSGGGILGGIKHDQVRQAASKFIQFANVHLPEMVPCNEFPLPESGHTSFYVLTPTAAFIARALDSELAECRHPFSLLFSAGHCIITQLMWLPQRDFAPGDTFERVAEIVRAKAPGFNHVD